MASDNDDEIKKTLEGMSQDEINRLLLKAVAKISREHRVLTVLVDSHQLQLESTGGKVQ